MDSEGREYDISFYMTYLKLLQITGVPSLDLSLGLLFLVKSLIFLV